MRVGNQLARLEFEIIGVVGGVVFHYGAVAIKLFSHNLVGFLGKIAQFVLPHWKKLCYNRGI